MDQDQQPPQKSRRVSFLADSTAGAFFSGLIGGGIAHWVIEKVRKRAITWKEIGMQGLGVGVSFAVLHLIFRKKEKAATQEIGSAVPPAPPTPPAQPERQNGLALGQVPLILDMLVAQGHLTPEQQANVLTQSKQGRKGFIAEIAIADGYVKPEQVEAALAQQAMMKTQAAVSDIQNIKDYGTLPTPAFLRANWGNNGVNPAVTAPTRTDGLSAAANIAQNLVMLANANPDPALRTALFNGVIAAASIANGIANGDSPVTPIAKMGNAWQQTMNDALTMAAAANPQLMTDANGKPIDVQQFIQARSAEINAAIAQTLQQSPGKGTGQGR